MGKWSNKGHHEQAMEIAKDLLDRGVGLSEAKEKTGLNEHDIEKAKEKMQGRR